MVFWYLTDPQQILDHVRATPDGVETVVLQDAHAPPRLYGIAGAVLTLEAPAGFFCFSELAQPKKKWCFCF